MAARWTLRVFPIALVALFLLAWIGIGGLPAWTSVGFGEELRHPNGLRTAVPQGYKVETSSSDGFRFGPVKAQRMIDGIDVRRVSAMPILKPSGQGVLTTGERYMIEDMGGGSGGTEYQLTAWKEAGDAWIVVVAIEQTEFGEPSFNAGWAVLERSTLE
jgi:hypothetical protein